MQIWGRMKGSERKPGVLAALGLGLHMGHWVPLSLAVRRDCPPGQLDEKKAKLWVYQCSGIRGQEITMGLLDSGRLPSAAVNVVVS